MGKINDLFRDYGPEYLTRYQENIPNEHRKVIQAISECRTEAAGLTLYQCTQCGEAHLLFRSCGNRHCPQCQYRKSQDWLEERLKQQLPGHHFLITFTVPETLRSFIRSHQRATYGALFKTSAEASKKLARDDKYIGGDLPGFFGVLHTPVFTGAGSGADSLSTTPISIMLSPAAHSPLRTPPGIRPAPTSICPSRP